MTEGCWHCHYEEGERKELNISIRVNEPNEAIWQLKNNKCKRTIGDLRNIKNSPLFKEGIGEILLYKSPLIPL